VRGNTKIEGKFNQMKHYTTINMKWFSLEFTPQERERIVIMWHRSEQHMIEYKFKIYKSRSKYPFGMNPKMGKILGWIPLPKENDIFVINQPSH
jgi:hypothetical protein